MAEEFVTVAAFPQIRRTDAVLLKGQLEAQGVTCNLDSAHISSGGELKLKVRSGQVLFAREFIKNLGQEAQPVTTPGFVESLKSVFEKLRGG